jgi:hypothetical protein
MALAVASKRTITRPLKMLIPLIQSELQQGNSAGHEHYRRAGEMLIEAKEQVAYGGWGRWLQKNFALHQTTANDYIRLARKHREFEGGALKVPPTSLRDASGDTERERQHRQSSQQQAFRRVLRDVAAETFVQERQARDDEIELHRELAVELIDIGYRALATKLHPDRGGSKEAMARLNRVRDELKQMAETRRFV